MRRHLQSPFRGPHLIQKQKDLNKLMSQVRVTVEWVFKDVINYFKHMDFKINLKTGLCCVGKMYGVSASAILTNAYIWLYKNNVSTFFGVDPTLPENYISKR